MNERTLPKPGPLLSQLLNVQRREEQLVQFPAIEKLAAGVVAIAQEIDGCLIWPVGPAAERVAGAAIVRSQGAIEVATWNTAVAGRRVLLLGLVGVSVLALETVADQLRRRGAAAVHACAVDVPGLASALCFDSYAMLSATGEPQSLSLVGDAA